MVQSSEIVERSSLSESSSPYSSLTDKAADSVVVSTHELPAPYGCRLVFIGYFTYSLVLLLCLDLLQLKNVLKFL